MGGGLLIECSLGHGDAGLGFNTIDLLCFHYRLPGTMGRGIREVTGDSSDVKF